MFAVAAPASFKGGEAQCNVVGVSRRLEIPGSFSNSPPIILSRLKITPLTFAILTDRFRGGQGRTKRSIAVIGRRFYAKVEHLLAA
jgi:hypothetical protein